MLRSQGLAFTATLFILSSMSPRFADAVDNSSFDSFDVKGVKIQYLVQGTGEPVVLIHGFHSSIRLNWQAPGIIDKLAKDHQVIALDLPGHGGSDRPRDADAYGEQMVDDVIELLDHLKIEKAHIVGYSMGGMVALKLIADHPDRVISGTLSGMGWLREGSRLQAFFERIQVRQEHRTPSECINSLGKLAITEDALKKIKVPMIVLVGDRDPVKQLYVVALQRVRDDWQVIDIKDAGHINCIMKSEFADELVKWIRKNRSK